MGCDHCQGWHPPRPITLPHPDSPQKTPGRERTWNSSFPATSTRNPSPIRTRSPTSARSRALAGIWIGKAGHDVSPKEDGPEAEAYIEHAEFQPIDAQTNGPQIFYGLRYHLRIVKPDDVETFHDQVGYWL